MTDFQPFEVDESAVGAVCSCMRCKAERYDSISKLNHHRAKEIDRLRDALLAIIDARMPGQARVIAAKALRHPVGGSREP